jgi:hypothetical protein
MLKHLVTLLLLPVFATAQTRTSDFIPKGWKLLREVHGDLNKDSIADAALIIEQTSKANFKRREGLGADTLNLNPRTLIVLFRQRDSSYVVAAKNTALIPKEHDEESPCLSDPLMETEGITIKKGVLGLYFKYWLSCGSYWVNDDTYLFRYQKGKFELIGYESDAMSRSTGDMITYSVNFSIRKWSSRSGDNMFSDPKEKPKTITKSFPLATLLELQTITPDKFGAVISRINESAQ